ncbi:replication protein A subunit RPA32 [Cristinia sonorae]|uniref:Replication protein A subunit RPA32 n=1 Tax=Cristinia sonorae TaxID=1940300 RepID=A0A8K0UZY0_9AGAR|nr:replication protein A subunit RPA32 [Cristinia sonorae]
MRLLSSRPSTSTILVSLHTHTNPLITNKMSQFGENPYYGNSGMGGGYMSGGGSQFNSPGGGSTRRAAQSLLPVTIKQINAATQAHTDAEWMLNDLELSQITVVAQVMSINKQATNTVYWLDDGTGRIEARHWIDSTMEDDEAPNPIIENEYARVLGAIKSFGQKRYINTSHARRVVDNNEIAFHYLDCAASKLLIQRGNPNAQPQVDVKPKIGGSSAYSAPSHGVSTDHFANLPPLERKIATFLLNQPSNPDGTHVGAIARAVGGEAAAISAALDRLMDEGHVYTTLDESHYNLSV